VKKITCLLLTLLLVACGSGSDKKNDDLDATLTVQLNENVEAHFNNLNDEIDSLLDGLDNAESALQGLVNCDTYVDAAPSHYLAEPEISGDNQYTVRDQVNVYIGIESCDSAADLANCPLRHGVYVIGADDSIADDKLREVAFKAIRFLDWAHSDVVEKFANATVVLGVKSTEAHTGTTVKRQPLFDAMIASVNEREGYLHGFEIIELSQQDQAYVTFDTTTFNKLFRLYAYYLNGDFNTSDGSALYASYESFIARLKGYETIGTVADAEFLTFDRCLYANGDTIDRDCQSFSINTAHQTAGELGRGILLGAAYEYLTFPQDDLALDGLVGSRGTWKSEGNLGQGLDNEMSWGNAAFCPIRSYLDTYFFTHR